MSIAIQWKGGDDRTSISSGSYIGFYGTAFNQSIPLDNYNGTTVVTNRLGTLNSGALPNVKFTTPGYGVFSNVTHNTISGSISTILGNSGTDMTLHIQIVSGSAVFLSSVNLIAYTEPDITQVPANMVVVGFESGSSDWTIMGGQSQPLALTPHISTAMTTHDYYVGVAISPTAKGTVTQVSFALQASWYR